MAENGSGVENQVMPELKKLTPEDVRNMARQHLQGMISWYEQEMQSGLATPQQMQEYPQSIKSYRESLDRFDTFEPATLKAWAGMEYVHEDTLNLFEEIGKRFMTGGLPKDISSQFVAHQNAKIAQVQAVQM